MNLGEIRWQARTWLDDTIGDDDEQNLWSDEDLNNYAREAVREACIRARLLIDSHTAVTRIQIVPNRHTYQLDPSIIFARRVACIVPSLPWDPSGPAPTPVYERALQRVTYDMLDGQHDWEFRRHGYGNANWQRWIGPYPERVVQDLEERALRLVPIPTVSGGHLQMTVVRYPIDCEIMWKDKDCPPPGIGEENHRFLSHWQCYRGYLHNDSQTYNKQESDRHLALFEAHFGTKPSAKEIRQLAHDRAGEIHSFEM